MTKNKKTNNKDINKEIPEAGVNEESIEKESGENSNNINENLKLEIEKAIDLEVYNELGPLNWRLFEDARNFVRSLKLKNGSAWFSYAKTKSKPISARADACCGPSKPPAPVIKAYFLLYMFIKIIY